MCELNDERMEAATRDEMQRVEAMGRAFDWIDAAFAPARKRAEKQARKIAEAARLCREADEEGSE